jgi:hypothetical protein
VRARYQLSTSIARECCIATALGSRRPLRVSTRAPAGRFIGTAEVPQKTDGIAAARILEGIGSRAWGDIPRLLLVLSRVKQTTHPKKIM